MNDNYNPLDKELNRLVQVIARLRAEDGCPWDREQTHGSLKAACVEEAAEVVGGINILEQTGNAENLKEELGDLLFSAVNAARFLKIDPEEALHEACNKFTLRFSLLEQEAVKRGKKLEDMTLNEMDELYELAKKTLRSSTH